MIFVIAVSELKEGTKDEFIRIAKENLPNVLAEEGCISYVLNEDFPSGLAAQKEVRENVLTFVECWVSIDHLKKHLQAPHMKEFMDKVRDLRISSSLQIVSPAC